ncbi:MAG: lipopolysaccharide heptosyltransferase II [Nitrospira sp.]|nr:lipopolysaccharide heptosyltransferase II [Nitrospira sp.]
MQDPPVSSVTSLDGASSSVSDRSRILLIKPSSLGDIVHTLPVVSVIKAQWPGSHITWFVKRQWADLVERVEGVDRVWPVDPTAWSWVKQGRALQTEGFDLAIDLQGLFRSAVLAYVSGAPLRIGFANGREGSPWFYTHRVPVLNPDVHAVDRYLLVAAALGIVVPKRPRFAFKVLDEDLEVVRGLFERNHLSIERPWVAMNVGARWPTKRWPLTSFSAAADLVYESYRDPMVLIGSSDDQPSVERLRELMKRPCIDLSGQIPLRCLPALLSKATVLITNDSGPMHIAAACGIPVVAIFGPTSATRTGPYGKGHHVLTGRVSCSPCFSRVCRHDPEMECLTLITPAHVADAVRPLLAAHGPSP